MATGTKEIHFEQHIEQALVGQGTYHSVSPKSYDKQNCLIPSEVLAFLHATQPRELEKLEAEFGASYEEKVLFYLAKSLNVNKTLNTLRKPLKIKGVHLRLAYFEPIHDKTPEHLQAYEQNRMVIVRQLKYSQKNENSIDMVLFVNGIPVVTLELKNALTGQTHQNAIKQYMKDRKPKGEPLLDFQRCLVHFAVGTEKVFMTTELKGARTFFLPFNKDERNISEKGSYAVDFLWEDVLRKASLLELIENFISLQTDEDKYYDAKKKSFKTKKSTKLLFPRFHQRRAVKHMLEALKKEGVGQRYLIQHSAGSGKSNTITWLAYRLSGFYQQASDDRGLFDTILVVTDRRVLDKQIQNNIRQLDDTPGLVAYIDEKKTSQDLKDAIESGKRIIVSTLQKFPIISETIAKMKDRNYAVIIDEAHSSQTGNAAGHLRKALSLDTAENDEGQEDDLETLISNEIAGQGLQDNISFFAFTATPKPKTLELFGTLRNGVKTAFDVYSMKQAIDEGFILDVLKNYMSFQRFYKIAKRSKVEDHELDRRLAIRLLSNYADLQDHAIETKSRIMLEQFAAHTKKEIQGEARAMLVTRSRLHAVRYKRMFDKIMQEMNLNFRALVAFSGTVHDPENGKDYTENNMNDLQGTISIPDALKMPEYRMLIVANKYQTGFDEPKLHTMFVDKKLGGTSSVQTLSRLNRTTQGKEGTLVIDFVNDPEEVLADFERYYKHNFIEEENLTDDNSLYDVQTRLESYHLLSQEEIEAFATIFFKTGQYDNMDAIQVILDAVAHRFEEGLSEEQQLAFKSDAKSYTKLYSFLRGIMTFKDTELEKWYVFLVALLKKLPYVQANLPLDILGEVELHSYKLQHEYTRDLGLSESNGEMEGMSPSGAVTPPEEEFDMLTNIIETLNETYGIDLTDEDRVDVEKMHRRLVDNVELKSYFNANNSRENIAQRFEELIDDELLNFINTKLDLYNKLTEDKTNKVLKDMLFTKLYEQRTGAFSR